MVLLHLQYCKHMNQSADLLDSSHMHSVHSMLMPTATCYKKKIFNCGICPCLSQIAIFNTELSVENFKAAMSIPAALGLDPTVANSGKNVPPLHDTSRDFVTSIYFNVGVDHRCNCLYISPLSSRSMYYLLVFISASSYQ